MQWCVCVTYRVPCSTGHASINPLHVRATLFFFLVSNKTALEQLINLLLSSFPLEISLHANQLSKNLWSVVIGWTSGMKAVNPGPSPGRKGTLPLAQAEMKTEQKQALTGCSTKQCSDWLSQQTLGWSSKNLFHWFRWVTWCNVSVQ